MTVGIIDGRTGLHEDKVLEWRCQWAKRICLQAREIARWKIEVRDRNVELVFEGGQLFMRCWKGPAVTLRVGPEESKSKVYRWHPGPSCECCELSYSLYFQPPSFMSRIESQFAFCPHRYSVIGSYLLWLTLLKNPPYFVECSQSEFVWFLFSPCPSLELDWEMLWGEYHRADVSFPMHHYQGICHIAIYGSASLGYHGK